MKTQSVESILVAGIRRGLVFLTALEPYLLRARAMRDAGQLNDIQLGKLLTVEAHFFSIVEITDQLSDLLKKQMGNLDNVGKTFH